MAGHSRAAEDPPEIAEIKKVYQDCQSIKKADEGTKSVIFADYGRLEDGWPAVWRLQMPKSGFAYSHLELYRDGDTIRLADRFHTSPSGDWSKTHEYCFRADGTLAWLFAELRTFLGDARVEDRLYYDPTGTQVRALRYAFDLKTGKRLDENTANFMDKETTIYLTVKAIGDDIGHELLAKKPKKAQAVFAEADWRRLIEQPIVIGGDPDFPDLDACGSSGEVVGLDPRGDGFLSVRSRPNGKEIDRLFNDQYVYICADSGNWMGIVYPESGQDPGECSVSTPWSTRKPYTGPCRYGWVFSKYIKLIAG